MVLVDLNCLSSDNEKKSGHGRVGIDWTMTVLDWKQLTAGGGQSRVDCWGGEGRGEKEGGGAEQEI